MRLLGSLVSPSCIWISVQTLHFENRPLHIKRTSIYIIAYTKFNTHQILSMSLTQDLNIIKPLVLLCEVPHTPNAEKVAK